MLYPDPNRGTSEISDLGLALDHGLSLSALESLPTAVLLVWPDHTIGYANRQVQELFGFTPSQLAGQRVSVILPGTFTQPPSPEARPVSRLLYGHRRDGSHLRVEVSSRRLETSQGTLLLVSVSDASGREPEAAAQSSGQRIEFERLVAELSVQFINLPAERVEGAIRDALRRIGERLDLDRCNFYRIQPDGLLTDPVWWVRPGFEPPPAPVKAEESFPWALDAIRNGRILRFTSVDDIPNPVDRDNYRSFGIRSAVTVPLMVEGRVVGAMGFNTLRAERDWDSETMHQFTVFAAAFNGVLARQKSDEALHTAFAEIERLRDRLTAENVQLRREVKERLGKSEVVGQSAAIQNVMAQVRQVALTDATVLLLGETGTGKELFASQIHELSARRGQPMIRVNCAAIPTPLIESELFGRERGAFTGALARQVGRFELANHSTIFLDEIGDLSGEVQVKLLRVLEERQIERLGSPRPIAIDSRIIAATHRNLERRMATGEFREDLFYRLNVFPIVIPPLRERVEDIPLLVRRFVEEFSHSFGKRFDGIPPENIAELQQYSWPGNVRELRNLVERAVIVAKGPLLTINLPAPNPAAVAVRRAKLVDVERDHIQAVLESTNWRIRGVDGAAERLGLRPTTLETRMAKLGLVRPDR